MGNVIIQISQNEKLAFFILPFIFGLVSCALTECNKVAFKPTGEPVSYFDKFLYKGFDDFYNENPLTDKGSFYNPVLPGWYSDPSICNIFIFPRSSDFSQ